MFAGVVLDNRVPQLQSFDQGIIDHTGTKTQKIISGMFVIAKMFEELFTPIGN